MEKQEIKTRLDDVRRELHDVLVSGRRVDASHKLIDAGFVRPNGTLDSMSFFAVDLARKVADTSAVFHKDSSGRADVGETALFATQLKYYLAEFFGEYYPSAQCRSWLTVDRSLPVGAREYSARRVLRHGHMKAVAAFGGDVPVVTVGAAEDLYRNVEYQAKCVWSLTELEQAAYSGFPLESTQLDALAMAAEQNFEQRWHVGDHDYGTFGFYDGTATSNIPLYAVVTGTWATATHDQIIGDLRALLYGIRAATGVSLLYPDTIVFASVQTQYLGVRRANTDINVRQAIAEEWPGMRVFESPLANTLDAAGTGPRILAFCSGRQASRFGEPRALELLPAQQSGTQFEVIGRQNLTGAILPQPIAFGHMDGC